MDTSGYSKTPLAQKLGIKEGYRVLVMNSPKPYDHFFSILPDKITLIEEITGDVVLDFIHIFARKETELVSAFDLSLPHLKKSGVLWISWPKKSSGIPAEIDKMHVLLYGQSRGLVDVKVASIDEQWSGHKFVYPLKDR